MVFAQTFISEINFKGEEYVEIYSNSSLDLQDSKVYDDLGEAKFNTLNKIKESSSNVYLVIGSKFKDSYNTDVLNCTIYQSDKSQVSNGGLKDTGEDLTIEVNSTLNLTFIKDSSFDFEDNESLNLLNNNIGLQSPCFINFSQEAKEAAIENVTVPLTNISNSTISNNSSNISQSNFVCDETFSITTATDFFESKIEFSFESSINDNFSIDYHIEDLESNIVKKRITTTNKNKKSFTPKKRTDVFNIKAKLSKGNCSYNSTKQVVFYSKFNNEENSKKGGENDVDIKKSYFKILNKGELTQLNTNILKYEAYKGTDTSKRTFLVYHGTKKINSIAVSKKDQKIKGEFRINLTNGLNRVLVTGLDLEEEFYILKEDVPNINFEQNFIIEQESNFFDLTKILVDDENVYFDINTNLDSLDGDCQIYLVRTKVSDSLNLSNQTFLINFLEINISKLKEKDSSSKTYQLKLSCKYKESHLKSFKYESKYFNYSIPKQTVIFNDSSNFDFLNKDSENKFETKVKNEIELSNFESKNVKIKNNSIFLSFTGLVLLFSSLLFKFNI